jgi:hypothetical protein
MISGREAIIDFWRGAVGARLLLWMKFEVVMVFALLFRGQIDVALGRQSGLDSWITPTLIATMLGTVGLHVFRMRRGR